MGRPVYLLVATCIFIISTALSERSESVDYYNGTSFPPPYDLSTASGERYGDVNSSVPEGSNGLTPKGLVDDSEEENLANQATTTTTPYPTYPETLPPHTRPPSTTTTTRRPPVTPSIPQNLTTPVSPGFSTEESGDNLGNKGNGQGGGNYQGVSPTNPGPAGPVPGSPIQDGPGLPGSPGPAADGLPDGPSTCLCAAICLTQTPGPQAPPGNGPCVSLCACVGASTQSGTPAPPPPPSKDVPGSPADASPQLPVGDLPGAAVGTDTAQGAVQDGTAVAASQAPPPPQPPQSNQ